MSSPVPFIHHTVSRLIIGILLLVMTGCTNHPVQNLASDIGLIKIGTTTRQEVLSFLGEPDTMKQISEGVEEWAYQEETRSSLQRMPVAGKMFSAQGYMLAILTINGNIVTAARYGSYDKDEFDWQDDYGWQKKTSPAEAKNRGQ
jgi:hypothetical protein